MFRVSSSVRRPAGAAGLSAPRVPACSGGPAGGRGRLPSPADDNHQGFASVNRAPEAARGGYPRLVFQHRPCQRERGTGRSSTAGCGVVSVGLKSVGGRSRRSRTRAGPDWHWEPPIGARGAAPRGAAIAARRSGAGPGGAAAAALGGGPRTGAERSGAERRAAVSPSSRGKRLPAGRRGRAAMARLSH